MKSYNLNVRKEAHLDKSNKVMTPENLCIALINHFKPTGTTLEPFRGTGNFYRNFPKLKDWCEIDEGRDFFDHNKHVDWIITNPPWAGLTKICKHCFEVADNVVLLIFFVGFSHRRFEDLRDAGFGWKEVVLVKTPPKPFPQFGFQLVALHFQRGYKGLVKFDYDFKY